MGRSERDSPTWPLWLLPGLALGLLMGPYQWMSELGFVLQQRLWPLLGLAAGRQQIQAALPKGLAPGLVFVATAALLALAWGPLASGRGGGLSALLAMNQRQASTEDAVPRPWLRQLAPISQLQRLLLLVLTHVGGLTVGVESPSAALGATALLAWRKRSGARHPLNRMPLELVGVIGAAAGLGAAFRSPLLGVLYGIEELDRRSRRQLVVPVLLLAGAGSLIATTLGQPARLPGPNFGVLPMGLWPWTLLLTLAGACLGALLVRALIPLADLVKHQMALRRWTLVLSLSALLTLLAIASDGLSLNDGSLSLAAALQGAPGGGPLTFLWRALATLLSVAAGAPGGIMHDTMTLGALLVTPLHQLAGLDQVSLAQLAAVGATALFAGANGTPIFCAVFVFTLQGNPASLPQLLLVSAVSASLAAPLRGEEWNQHQANGLLASILASSETATHERDQPSGGRAP
ncbi:MAG: chloride channel protein [Cyanobium sp.]